MDTRKGRMSCAGSVCVLALSAVLSAHAYASWIYSERTDPMTSKTINVAQIKSDNSLSLSAPYGGANYGWLVVRWLSVVVGVEKGQIICGTTSDKCSVSVRFDEAPPVSFSATRPADHSSNILILQDSLKFIDSAQQAKRIVVQMTFYQNGQQVMTFTTPQPLNWPISESTRAGLKESEEWSRRSDECTVKLHAMRPPVSATDFGPQIAASTECMLMAQKAAAAAQRALTPP